MKKETTLLINSLLDKLYRDCNTAALVETARGNFDAAERLKADQRAVMYAIDDFNRMVIFNEQVDWHGQTDRRS